MPPSRPSTAHSIRRPTTAQSTTTTSDPLASERTAVVAVLQGKGVGREVGVATYDIGSSRVALSQLSDSPSFAKTHHLVSLSPPSTLLFIEHALPKTGHADGGGGGVAVRLAEEWEGEGTEVVSVPRKYWSDQAGTTFLEQLTVEDEDRPALLVASEQKYLALCATAALFQYLASSLNLVFAPASLKIRWDPLEGTMYVDGETARNLELVRNRANVKSNQSLFGALNKTHTPMASRLLRSNLLQPPRVQSIVEGRLDAVDELLANEDRFDRLRSALVPLAKVDLDKLISGLTHDPTTTTRAGVGGGATEVSRAERRVVQMLMVRTAVGAFRGLSEALQGVQSELLVKCRVVLDDEQLAVMDQLIGEQLEDDPSAADRKRTGLAQRNAKIYAVKASQSRLLDVARETFKENVNDIVELVAGYQNAYNLPTLSVTFGQTTITLIVGEEDVGEEGLPDVFKNVVKKGAKKFSCTTLELKKRQQRYNDSLAEIFLLSDQVIQQLLKDLLRGVGALYKSSEAVAMLDLLCSHAHCASLMNYVRPEFTGTLAIKGGKHPILDKFSGETPVVANDVYASRDTSSFQLVTGPNMSGKTTYLTTIGLLIIQAMIGSFVPAEYASVALNDALLSRLSNDDDPSSTLSTFASEMRSTASILSLVSPESLVLIDELGRGTSTLEGTALAHAIAEELVKSKAACFFSTHFRDLSITLSGYPSVQNLHLQVDNTRKGIVYNYKILDGCADEPHYGLQLAAVAGLPADVLDVARDVSTSLSQLEQAGKRASRSAKTTHRRRVLLAIRERLVHALSSDLDSDGLAEYLAFVQKEAVRDMDAVE